MKSNTFETGQTAGTAITTANSGGGAGDAFNSVVNSANCTYESDHVMHGSLSMKVAIAGTASYVAWTSSGNTDLTQYGRTYLYLPVGFIAAGIGASAVALRNQAGGLALSTISVSSTGVLRVLNAASVQVANTYQLADDIWYRIEWKIFADPTAGECSGSVYNGDSTTALAAIGASGINTNTAGSIPDAARIGLSNNVTQTLYFDDAVIGDTNFPGPSVTPTIPNLRTIRSALPQPSRY